MKSQRDIAFERHGGDEAAVRANEARVRRIVGYVKDRFQNALDPGVAWFKPTTPIEEDLYDAAPELVGAMRDGNGHLVGTGPSPEYRSMPDGEIAHADEGALRARTLFKVDGYVVGSCPRGQLDAIAAMVDDAVRAIKENERKRADERKESEKTSQDDVQAGPAEATAAEAAHDASDDVVAEHGNETEDASENASSGPTVSDDVAETEAPGDAGPTQRVRSENARAERVAENIKRENDDAHANRVKMRRMPKGIASAQAGIVCDAMNSRERNSILNIANRYCQQGMRAEKRQDRYRKDLDLKRDDDMRRRNFMREIMAMAARDGVRGTDLSMIVGFMLVSGLAGMISESSAAKRRVKRYERSKELMRMCDSMQMRIDLGLGAVPFVGHALDSWMTNVGIPAVRRYAGFHCRGDLPPSPETLALEYLGIQMNALSQVIDIEVARQRKEAHLSTGPVPDFKDVSTALTEATAKLEQLAVKNGMSVEQLKDMANAMLIRMGNGSTKEAMNLGSRDGYIQYLSAEGAFQAITYIANSPHGVDIKGEKFLHEALSVQEIMEKVLIAGKDEKSLGARIHEDIAKEVDQEMDRQGRSEEERRERMDNYEAASEMGQDYDPFSDDGPNAAVMSQVQAKRVQKAADDDLMDPNKLYKLLNSPRKLDTIQGPMRDTLDPDSLNLDTWADPSHPEQCIEYGENGNVILRLTLGLEPETPETGPGIEARSKGHRTGDIPKDQLWRGMWVGASAMNILATHGERFQSVTVVLQEPDGTALMAMRTPRAAKDPNVFDDRAGARSKRNAKATPSTACALTEVDGGDMWTQAKLSDAAFGAGFGNLAAYRTPRSAMSFEGLGIDFANDRDVRIIDTGDPSGSGSHSGSGGRAPEGRQAGERATQATDASVATQGAPQAPVAGAPEAPATVDAPTASATDEAARESQAYTAMAEDEKELQAYREARSADEYLDLGELYAEDERAADMPDDVDGIEEDETEVDDEAQKARATIVAAAERVLGTWHDSNAKDAEIDKPKPGDTERTRSEDEGGGGPK